MRPLFLCLKPSERERKPTHKAKKARQRAGKQARQEAKQGSWTRGEKKKTKGKRTKSRANTPQAFNPPNLSRTQKPHKPRKARKQYKPTQTPQTTLKTPLKCETKAHSRSTHDKQSGKGTKGRASGSVLSYLANVSKIAPRACTPATQWTRSPPPQKRMKAAPRKPRN